MFGKLIEGWKARKAVQELEKHPVYGVVLLSLRETLSDTSQGIGKYWSQEGKEGLIRDVLQDIERSLSQPNPTQAVRMRAIDFMLEAAQFDVLIMQPPTNNPELSGELKAHIPELAKLDPLLEKFFYNLDSGPTDFNGMWDAILMRYWLRHLYMNAYNMVRCSVDDWYKDRTKDWFRPCYTSFCIWLEDGYRQKLGLPSMIQGEQADMKSIMYSTWMNRAEEGHKELRLVWEKSWQDVFHAPSQFDGVEV